MDGKTINGLRLERGVQLLNIKAGGLGGKHSEETRLRLSQASKGRKHSPEHIEKQRQRMIGRPKSAEHRRKLSESRKGIRSRLGIRHRPESIEKMRQNQRRKLTEAQTEEIKVRYKKGETGCGYRRLGQEYGVTFSMIRHIIKGQKPRPLMKA